MTSLPPLLQLAQPAPQTATEQAIVRAEQLKLLFGSLPTALWAAALNVIVLAVVSHGHVETAWLWGWTCTSLGIGAVRGLVSARYHRAAARAGPEGPRTSVWLRRFLLGNYAAGLAWGSAPIVLFPDDATHQIFLAFMLSGVAAGATATLGPVRAALVPFGAALTLPLSVRFLLSGSELGLAVGLVSLLFLTFVVTSGLKNHAAVSENLLLRIRLSRSEALMSETGRLLEVGGWELDIPSSRVRWSDEVFRIHELPPGRELSLEEALGFYSGEAQQEVKAAVSACINEGTPWDLQTEFVTAKGKRLWVRSLGHAEFRRGKPVRLVGSFQNVTRIKEVENELIASKNLAEAATKAKSQFLATMSHEIRTPMNGVLGLSKILLDTPLSPDQHRLVENIHASGETLLTVINEVLDFSRIEAGRLEIVEGAFDLGATLEGVLALLRPEAVRKGLDLRLAYPGPAPHTRLRGDASRIRQVLLNLVGNAVKFTNTGSVVVSAEVGVVGGTDSAQVRLAVADTGPGIPHLLHERLFEPFTQGDARWARQHGGSGLGLAITRQLVQLMGGSIHFVSEPGQGTTFTVDLPLALEEASEAPTPSARTPEAQEGRPTWQRAPRVLVVEDNEVNQLVAQRLLEKLDCIVHMTGNGFEALSEWHAHDFDLVFTDCQMPGMDGFELTQAIRTSGAKGAAVPIVALTANAFQEDQDRCLAAGMTDYLTKPVSATKLRSVLLARLPALVTPSAPAE
ncbi:MAG: response regulator [Myxococcales bacterium]|nr:response regulator [Myxococcales bacterium]